VLNLGCRHHAALYSRAQTGDVSRGERAGLAVHKIVCPGCRALDKQLRRLRASARRLARAELGPALEAVARPPGAEIPADVRARLLLATRHARG
jgi:hypothetical protein